MRIGVDIDNVMVQWQNHWAELYKEWFAPSEPLDLDSWNACIEQTHFNNMAEFFEWFEGAMGWHDIPTVPGSLGAIDALIREGHRPVFITARPESSRGATEFWHQTVIWRAFRNTTELHLRSDKWSVKCDVYVDDSPEVIKGLVENDRNAIVFDCPWNRDLGEITRKTEVKSGSRTVKVPLEKLVKRATDWSHALELIGEFA